MSSALEIIKEEKKDSIKAGKIEINKKKAQPAEARTCRICLCEESEEKDDPIISVCRCKGYAGNIHLMCLREWLNSKRKINKHSNF